MRLCALWIAAGLPLRLARVRPAAPRPHLPSLLASSGLVHDDVCSTAPCNQNCTASGDVYQCSCFAGFELVRSGAALHGECIDVDECKVDNGGCVQVCVNEPGTHHCECAPGYGNPTNGTVNGTNGSATLACVDIDECAAGLCAHHCVNSPGSFACSCAPGYVLEPDGRNCSDVDECAVPGACNHFCMNHIGSYECGCHHGFAMTLGGTCEDIDECAESNGMCEHGCVNNAGGFFCTCREGFKQVFNRCFGPLETAPTEPWPHFLSRRLNETGRSWSFNAPSGPGSGVTTTPGSSPLAARSPDAKLAPLHALVGDPHSEPLGVLAPGETPEYLEAKAAADALAQRGDLLAGAVAAADAQAAGTNATAR